MISGGLDTSRLATKELQEALLVAIASLSLSSENSPIKDYEVNEIEEVGSITYFGLENKNGAWCVKKINETVGTVYSYATITNNAGTASYSVAWANRATLVYSNYSGAF